MNKSVLILAGLLLIILGILGGLYWVNNETNEAFSPDIDIQEVKFEEAGETVYIRAVSWGISGNHNEVMITTEPVEPEIRKPEEERDYIFYTMELYYKKKGIDSLLIYAPSSSIGDVPSNFSEKIKIVLLELKTFDEIRDYEQNYNEYGLTRIRTYPSSPSE